MIKALHLYPGRVIFGLYLSFFLYFSGYGQVNVVMQHNNLSRTGANLQETILNPSDVDTSQFGFLWSYPVSGQVYAQPLYVSGVNIPGIGIKNILYIADMNNDVYAFDADRDTMYWTVNLGQAVTLPDADFVYTSFGDILQEVGICSTPAIDTLTNTIYIEAKTKVSAGVYTDSLHALDITTGAPKFEGSEFIAASVPGTAYKDPGTVTFEAQNENQRPAIVISNGVVYLSYASYGDGPNYEGWILGYNAHNIHDQVIVFNDDPNGQTQSGTSPDFVYYARAGIWMSGQGPAVDASGNLYVISGNGTFDSTAGNDYGDSFMKLTPDTTNRTLTVTDWFTPYNQSYLDANDLDLGSDGPMLIPNTSYLTAGCKQGIIYLIDENNMGHYHSDSDLVKQQIYAFGAGNHVHGSAVFWGDTISNPNTGLTYWWSEANDLQSFRFSNGEFNITPTAKGPPAPTGLPGGILSLSANESQSGSAILWACIPISLSAHQTVPGMLRAFDARNVSVELWNSQMNASRDSVGNFAKFCPPTVTNGKVYVATFSNKVQAYGLLIDLPVNLTSFTAVKDNLTSNLQWTTGSEQNNDHFEVERSPDAVNFTQIGTVKGSGTTSISEQYHFTDETPLSGVNFYRLKQVDFDGKATFSRIVSVDFGQEVNSEFNIYPNPASGQFNIQLGNWSASQIELRMVSVTGDIVYEKTFNGAGLKDNTISISRTTAMGDGLYFIFLTDGSGHSQMAKLMLIR